MSLRDTISIPEFCLVLLIGPSGSGKSTFARKHFKETEIISSDTCRAIVSDDETDQSATKDAFELVEYIAQKRLAARRLTVIDATNVKPEDRRRFITLAKRYHALPVGMVFFVDEKTCHARNQARENRNFGLHVVRNHLKALKRGFKGLQKREGVRLLHVFDSPEEMDALQTIERTPLWPDKRGETGPFDIIGDIHGCAGELESLLAKLGYQVDTQGEPGLRSYTVTPPDGRRAIFVGDLVDRGPRSPDVLRLVKSMVEAGTAFCVIGNHENKLIRKLNGRNVKLTHGLAETVEQFEQQPEGFAQEMRDWLDGLISHYVFDDGRLVVAHAGLTEDLQNRASGKVRSFAMYGDTTGETDEYGLPVRADWAADYRGRAAVVYGHTPTLEAEWVNGTICIDTGCVFGGKLTALRWPEKELVDVPAEQVWSEPVKPLVKPETLSADPTAIKLSDVMGKRTIETHIGGRVTISEAAAAGALETMSRFAVDPRWLIHLPPTMSPVETSPRDGWLERPEEAFDYYRRQGVSEIICEEKHMGSRAIAVICKDADAARKHFHATSRDGVIYTRTGRPFFKPGDEGLVIERLRKAITKAGWWKQFQTDWVCLDMEIMPWSAKAQSLIRHQYAPVGSAASIGLDLATKTLQDAVRRGVDVGEMLAKTQSRKEATDKYNAAYQPYIWPVNSVEDLKLAPFHLLATERHVYSDKTHDWHMKTLAGLCAHDPIITQTHWRVIDVNDSASCEAATLWWEEMTAKGGEGMVVKPLQYVSRGPRGLIQPAVKVRGKDYLRIIYGPDYDAPHHLERLKQRGLGKKRSMALREFRLGLEALERFTQKSPLARVHECVFAVLALETEPVDPRL